MITKKKELQKIARKQVENSDANYFTSLMLSAMIPTINVFISTTVIAGFRQRIEDCDFQRQCLYNELNSNLTPVFVFNSAITLLPPLALLYTVCRTAKAKEDKVFIYNMLTKYFKCEDNQE